MQGEKTRKEHRWLFLGRQCRGGTPRNRKEVCVRMLYESLQCSRYRPVHVLKRPSINTAVRYMYKCLLSINLSKQIELVPYISMVEVC